MARVYSCIVSMIMKSNARMFHGLADDHRAVLHVVSASIVVPEIISCQGVVTGTYGRGHNHGVVHAAVLPED